MCYLKKNLKRDFFVIILSFLLHISKLDSTFASQFTQEFVVRLQKCFNSSVG